MTGYINDETTTSPGTYWYTVTPDRFKYVRVKVRVRVAFGTYDYEYEDDYIVPVPEVN